MRGTLLTGDHCIDACIDDSFGIVFPLLEFGFHACDPFFVDIDIAAHLGETGIETGF